MVETTMVGALPTGSGEASRSAVTWSAIIAGGVAAAAVSFILLLLGVGLGLTSVSPWSNAGASAATLGIGAIVWLIVIQWVSAGFGGYLTGRLRTKWVSVHTHEVFFRDTAHGFLSWALGVVISAALLASAASAIVSGVGSAASTALSGAATVASGAAQAATQGASQGMTSGIGSPLSYYVDMLFRAPAPGGTDAGAAANPPASTDAAATPAPAATTPAPADATAAPAATTPAPAATTPAPAAGATPPAGGAVAPAANQANGNDMQAVRGETERILVTDMASGDISAPDKAYLGQLIAARTGLSQADAEKRVDDVVAQAKAAADKAKQAADTARKAAAAFAFFTFFSLLIGAFISSVAAAYGGHLRDEFESIWMKA